MTNFDEPAIHPGRILFGAALMVIGVSFLMDRLHLIGAETLAIYWPLLLVAYGLTRIMVSSRRPGAKVGGMWIAIVGGLLLLDRLEIAPLRESWPVLVILAGLMVVFEALGWLPSRGCPGGVIRRGNEAGR